jgi:hypothetical protein
MDEHPYEIRSTFAAPTGGVMTEEVGAVTGELELLTRPFDGALQVLVRYAGAKEWYTVEGGPVAASGETAQLLGSLHERVLAHLTEEPAAEAGDASEGGNAPSTSLG